MDWKTLISILCLALALILTVHHTVIHGIPVQWEDINNHETVILCLVSFALGLLSEKIYLRFKRKA